MPKVLLSFSASRLVAEEVVKQRCAVSTILSERVSTQLPPPSKGCNGSARSSHTGWLAATAVTNSRQLCHRSTQRH
jgi:hypothetical protein